MSKSFFAFMAGAAAGAAIASLLLTDKGREIIAAVEDVVLGPADEAGEDLMEASEEENPAEE